MDQIQDKEHICNDSHSQLSQLFSLCVKHTSKQKLVSYYCFPSFGSHIWEFFIVVLSKVELNHSNKFLTILAIGRTNFCLIYEINPTAYRSIKFNLNIEISFYFEKILIFILVFYGNKICFPNAHKVYVSQSRLLVFIAHCDDSSRLQDLHPIIIIYSQTA